MSRNSKIEWTEDTWNPVRGCTRVSPGCQHCYAEQMAARFSGFDRKTFLPLPFHGFAKQTAAGGRWTGRVEPVHDKLVEPLSWKKPRTVFVNSMSDLFHENVPFDFIDQVFAVMAMTGQHTYQVLTKRPERAAEYFNAEVPLATRADLVAAMHPRHVNGRLFTWGSPMESWERGAKTDPYIRQPWPGWPLSNVWLGVSVENRKHGLPRVDILRTIPAAVRFLSIEPLLEDLGKIDLTGIDWVIVGGESGPKARPMRPGWARTIREACAFHHVPFFFKQYGEWVRPESTTRAAWDAARNVGLQMGDGSFSTLGRPDEPDAEFGLMTRDLDGNDGAAAFAFVGKKAAGRILDGRLWDEMPTPR